MTVEAAYVVPVAIALIFFVIYSAFYLYNRCLITQNCYSAAYRESVWKGKNASGAEAVMQSYDGIFLHGYNYDVKGGSTARAQGRGSVFPVSIESVFPGVSSQWELTVGMNARHYDPPKAFRTYRRTTALLTKGSGT